MSVAFRKLLGRAVCGERSVTDMLEGLKTQISLEHLTKIIRINLRWDKQNVIIEITIKSAVNHMVRKVILTYSLYITTGNMEEVCFIN